MTGQRPDVDPLLGAPPVEPSPQEDQRSLGDIVGDVAENLTTLVKQEMELARTELKQEAAKPGRVPACWAAPASRDTSP